MSKNIANEIKDIVVKQLEKHPKAEHGINILKAALAGIPVFGGIFTSLVSDYMPKSKIERLLKFTKTFAEDLDRFKDEIDKTYIKTDEFSYIFEKTFKAIMENYQEEKLAGFRAILVNSLRDKTTKQEEKEFFLSILDNLTAYHFRFLSVFKDPVGWNAAHGNRVRGASMTISLNQILRQCFSDLDQDTIKTVIDDLFNKGLSSISSDRLMTMQTGGGIEKLNHALTPIGRKFIEFATLA